MNSQCTDKKVYTDLYVLFNKCLQWRSQNVDTVHNMLYIE